MLHLRHFVAAVCLTFVSVPHGAAAQSYASIQVGTLKGKLIVQWVEPDLFIFIPDPADPLRFTRSNGRVIRPGRMMTDGGSIPRSLWILRNYSPWGFAPGFIMHDWLFNAKHCGIAGYNVATVEEAALILAEVMKTMVAQGKVDASPLTVMSIYQATKSSVARDLWDKGPCNPPPAGLASTAPIQQYVLSF